MHRSFLQRSLRVILLVVVAFGSLAFVAGSWVLWGMLAALLAQDGPYRLFVGALLLVLTVELIGGLGLGTLSLPFALMAFAMAVAGQVLQLAPWSVHDRWALSAFLRAGLVGSVIGLGMAASAIVMVAAVYGFPVLHALTLAPWLRMIGVIFGTVFVTLVVVRRIDIPFRVRTEFGS